MSSIESSGSIGGDGATGNQTSTEFEVDLVYLNFFDCVMPATCMVKIRDTWGVADIHWDEDDEAASVAWKAWPRSDPMWAVRVYRIVCKNAQDEYPETDEGDLLQVPHSSFTEVGCVTAGWVVEKLTELGALDELEMAPQDGGFFSSAVLFPPAMQGTDASNMIAPTPDDDVADNE